MSRTTTEPPNHLSSLALPVGIYLDITLAREALAAQRAARDQRLGTPWRTYCGTAAWRTTRDEWFQEEERRGNAAGVVNGWLWYFPCHLCGKVRGFDVLQLHHVTYERVPHEHHEDMVCLCKPCHDGIERFIHDEDADWSLRRPLPSALPDPEQEPGAFVLHLWPHVDLRSR